MEDLKSTLQRLEAQIKETKKRLPAHSVKPPVMMDLLELEDEYDMVLNELTRLKQKNDGEKRAAQD